MIPNAAIVGDAFQPDRARADHQHQPDADPRRQQVVGLARHRDVDIQRRDPRADRRHRRLRRAAIPPQPPAEPDERQPTDRRQHTPRLLADPPPRDRDRQEERDAQQHRDPTHPREHPPTEHVLERNGLPLPRPLTPIQPPGRRSHDVGARLAARRVAARRGRALGGGRQSGLQAGEAELEVGGAAFDVEEVACGGGGHLQILVDRWSVVAP
jgi:hypothetical protein